MVSDTLALLGMICCDSGLRAGQRPSVRLSLGLPGPGLGLPRPKSGLPGPKSGPLALD